MTMTTEQDQTVTLAVEGGEVVMSTRLTGRDFLLLWKLMTVDTDSAGFLELYGPILDMLDRHTVSHTLDRRPIIEREMPVLRSLWAKWTAAINEASLDPQPAND